MPAKLLAARQAGWTMDASGRHSEVPLGKVCMRLGGDHLCNHTLLTVHPMPWVVSASHHLSASHFRVVLYIVVGLWLHRVAPIVQACPVTLSVPFRRGMAWSRWLVWFSRSPRQALHITQSRLQPNRFMANWFWNSPLACLGVGVAVWPWAYQAQGWMQRHGATRLHAPVVNRSLEKVLVMTMLLGRCNNPL